MFDPKTFLGGVAGPAGYAIATVAEAAKGEKDFGTATTDENAAPVAVKLVQDLMSYVKKPFAAEGDEAVEEVVEATDGATAAGSVASSEPKKYSVWDWIVFALTVLAIITSWTLNNNVDVRAKLGYTDVNATAGILISLLYIFGIFMFGPWLYFLMLLVPLFQLAFKTPNGVYWIEGIKRSVADPAVPADNKFITKYLAMMPQYFESPKTVSVPGVVPVPAQFGHFYY
jgi:hypothetical protein